MPAKNLVDRVDRQPDAVEPEELVAQPLDAKPPALPEREDAALLGREHPPARRGMRAAATISEAVGARREVATPPFAERRPRNAASSAGEPGIARPLVHLHPNQPRLRRHGVLPVRSDRRILPRSRERAE